MARTFDGFLVATEPGIMIPRTFFTDVLPGIQDLAELHVTLAAFRLAADEGGIESPIAERGIVRDPSLRTSMRVTGSPREPDRRIAAGLELATSRGTLLQFTADFGESVETWYYVNTPANQALVAAMSRGAIAPPESIWKERELPAIRPERPNVFRLYEQNIGLLSPLLADQLIDALEQYPAEWIEEAISESVSYNRRSWRYIQRILEKWASEGRESAAPSRSRP